MTGEVLTSARNPMALRMRALRTRKGRDAEGLMLVEGRKMIDEALACGLSPALALYLPDRDWGDQVSALIKRGADVRFAAAHVLDAVCDTTTPQGCAAAFSMPKTASLSNAHRLVALDGVQDPGNVGTIWRTADAAGYDGILLGADSADPFAPKTQRAAMGSGFRLPCEKTDDLAAYLSKMRGADIVVSDLRGDLFYEHPPLRPRFVLVIGSEARGVSEAVAACATMRLKLPMRGGAESLNAAVAAGVMLYELTRDMEG